MKTINLYLLALTPIYAFSDLHVAITPDGSGPYKTIQNAIDRAPYPATGRLIVEIPPGTYRERVMIPQERPRVTFLGRDPSSTKITFNMAGSTAGGDYFSPTVDVEGTEFEAYNITFDNSFGRGSNAFAMAVHSDRAIFHNCRFTGLQDTLYAAWGRQYYRDCYIEGAGDYIFGNAAAVFERCEIHSRARGHITAVSRVAPDQATGFVFDRCRLTAEENVASVYLGRPWRPYARVVFIQCWMGGHIHPEGWNDWQKSETHQTAWFGEYGSTGPGADAAKRVPWSHVLTAQQTADFLADRFLRGTDGWRPASLLGHAHPGDGRTAPNRGLPAGNLAQVNPHPI